MTKKEFTDKDILEMANKLHLRTLDELITACLDEFGEPKAPSKRAIMEARKMLPVGYDNTLIR